MLGNGRGENQAGERVGVAKALRLGSQQTAEPTALGISARFGRQNKLWGGFDGMGYRLWVKKCDNLEF